MDEPRFRRDLFKGTAADYDRFRPRYPESLLNHLLTRTGLETGGRMLDLACGTGQIAFDLAHHFAIVCAVDQEPDAITFAERKAERLGVVNIDFRIADAETLDAGSTPFDLVAIGNAFHRLRRGEVARAARRWLRPGGFLALLWGGTPNVTPGLAGRPEAEWQVAIVDVMRKWMGIIGEERVPATLQAALDAEPDEAVVEAAGYELVGVWEFLEPYVWSVETLTGYLYSTSVLSRLAIGERAPEFEADVRDQLMAREPSGVFRQELSFAYRLARSAG
jgi:ubiquinone/menaquinone biosynthesis C-methylase UbiE